jgi:hypothetical protein
MSLKYAYCKVSISPVRAENKDQAEIVTQLLFGEVFQIEEIEGSWCKIVTYYDNYPGWIDVKHFKPLTEKEFGRWMDGVTFEKSIYRNLKTPWGNQRIVKGSFIPFSDKLPFKIGHDEFQLEASNDEKQLASIYDTALEYLNSPYLWGGKTPFGIDCSGFTQTVFRFFGINLPRDASQQVEHGLEIDFAEHESGDVAFFHNKNGKIIHVGILNGNGEIIHASGCVRIDFITIDGIVHKESDELTHQLNCIKRY